MYPLESMNPRSAAARREKLLRTVADYRPLAGPMPAWADAHERALAELAVTRLLAANGVAPGRRPALAAMRRRLGEVLVAAGTRVLGTAHAAEVGPAAAPGLQ